MPTSAHDVVCPENSMFSWVGRMPDEIRTESIHEIHEIHRRTFSTQPGARAQTGSLVTNYFLQDDSDFCHSQQVSINLMIGGTLQPKDT